MTAEALHRPTPPAPVVPRFAVVTPQPYVPLALCRCGHEVDAHDHDRDGCRVCGAVRCRSFRRRTGRAARSSYRR